MDQSNQFRPIHNQQHHSYSNHGDSNSTGNSGSRTGFRQASAVMNQLDKPNYIPQNQSSFNSNGNSSNSTTSNSPMPVIHRQEQEHHETVFSHHHQQQQAPQYQHQSHYNSRSIHQSTTSNHSSASVSTSSSTNTATSLATITAVAAIAAASSAASSLASSSASNVPPLDLPPPSHNYQPHSHQHHQGSSSEYPAHRNETQMQHNNRQQIPPSPSFGARNGQGYPVRSESASPYPQQQQQQSRYTPQPRSEYIPQVNHQQQQRPQHQQTSTALVPMPSSSSSSSSSSAQYQPPPSPSQPIIRAGFQNQRQTQAPSPSPDNMSNNQQQQQQMSAFVPANDMSKKRRAPTSLDALHDDVRGSKGSALFPKSSGTTSTVFGTIPFHSQDISVISDKLKKPLLVEDVMVRRGPGGKKLLYLSHEGAVNHANELFGWDGWSFEIIDFSEQVQRIEQDKFRVSVRLFGAIVLKNGMFKKDFGFGSSVGTHADAWEMSYKTASSDCQKRCLRLFGSYLGNCLYNKDFHDELLEEKMKTNPKIL